MQAFNDPGNRSSLAVLLRGVPSLLLRLTLGVLTLVMTFMLMLGALLVAAVLTIGLLGWAVVRGRRLAPGTFSATFQRSRRHGHMATGAAAGPVIDVEARVVPDDTGALSQPKP